MENIEWKNKKDKRPSLIFLFRKCPLNSQLAAIKPDAATSTTDFGVNTHTHTHSPFPSLVMSIHLAVGQQERHIKSVGERRLRCNVSWKNAHTYAPCDVLLNQWARWEVDTELVPPAGGGLR